MRERITSVTAPVPGPISITKDAVRNFSLSMRRWASAGELGTTDPVVKGFLRNPAKNFRDFCMVFRSSDFFHGFVPNQRIDVLLLNVFRAFGELSLTA